MTNGGLVASDPGLAHDTLRASGMDDFVVSVDRVLPQLLEQQRSALLAARIGIVAVLVTVLSFIVGLMQAAAMWSARHRQLIVVRRLAGHSVMSVAWGRWLVELGVSVLALSVASAIALFDVTIPRPLIAATALGLGMLAAALSGLVLARSVVRSSVYAVERRI